LSCLASQLALERTPADVVETPVQSEDPRLSFVLGIGEIDLNGPNAIYDLLRRCMQHLNCVSAVFCVPDLDLTEIAEATADEATRAQLDTTRKHLLAWVQLNNRPMVVNRVDAVKAPYKILSCPVVDREAKTVGIIALFRGADSVNFELNDVRVIEFLSRQAMVLLSERQDPVSGLMIGSAFERLLDEKIKQPSGAAQGTLLYIDINDLKSINAAFGFSAGDEVILRTAQLIRRSLIAGEIGCRLSADRFVAYLPERDLESAMMLGTEIAKSAEELGYASAGQQVPLALRFGVAAPPKGPAKSRHWIASAELACQVTLTAHGGTSYNAL
jgi:diguanylate cyclase (GGDEF)-like protein